MIIFWAKVGEFLKERRFTMKCMRCGCMMAYEKFYGEAEDFEGWRCICCGEIVDQVILNNRLKQDPKAKSRLNR